MSVADEWQCVWLLAYQTTYHSTHLLSYHKVYLSLQGLTSLSDANAEFFASHEGELDLRQLAELSDDGARKLSVARGKIFSDNSKLVANKKKEEQEKQRVLLPEKEKNAAAKRTLMTETSTFGTGAVSDESGRSSHSNKFDLWRAVATSLTIPL